MYYEVYIDKIFLDNLIMDFFILSLTGRILKRSMPFLRTLLGSAAGAGGMCILILLPIQNTFIYMAVGFGGICLLMLKISCRIKKKAEIRKGILVLYLAAFFMGGIMQTLSAYVPLPVMELGVLAYLLLRALVNRYEDLKHRTEHLYAVKIYHGNQQRQITALRDTGNQLVQPITGKPVSIIDYTIISELLEDHVREQLQQMYNYSSTEKITEQLCYIPYHSIGESSGLLPGLKLDAISICIDGEWRRNERVVVAVTKDSVSAKGEYQMILHPLTLDN